MNFFDPRWDHRPGLLSRLPDWATAAAIPIALGAMAYRSAWPTPAEAVLFGATILCVLGTFYLPSRAARVSSAAAWVLLLIVWGLPTPARSLGIDFRTFYDGAELLYKRGDSPYLAQGTTAFPFPTFPLVWALSLAGRLSSNDTFLLFVLLQSALLAIGYILLDRTARQEALSQPGDPAQRIVQAGLLFHPTVLSGIALGNSGALAGAAIMWAVWFWRCGRNRTSLHASAIFLNLGWMIKPQLLMACLFFLCTWGWESWRAEGCRSRAASVGQLLLPWAGVLLGVSLLLSPPVILSAYREFPGVALTWHTRIAESYPTNYALSAILAKAMARGWSVPVSQSLPLLTVGIALPLVLWNILSLVPGKLDSLAAFFPWLLTSLFWTSLVWEWYFVLVLAAPALMLAFKARLAGDRWDLRLPLALACTMVFSSFLFMLGLIWLYCHAHALRLQEIQRAEK